MRPLNREFAVAVHERSIDACQDIEELRDVAKSLLRIWQLQVSVSETYGAELLGIKRNQLRDG